MKQINEDIKKHTFHSVYLIYGEEEYLVKLYKNKLKDAVLDGEDEMNYSYFQGKDFDFNEVRDLGDTLPFFADYRVLLMEETGLFKSSNDFADILAGFPESTIVIFVEKEVDKRNKLYKYVKKSGIVSEMAAMQEKETKQFVAVELKKAGKKIRESTVSYLLEQVDHSLFNLQNELEKLISYAYDREEVTKEDIDAVCSIQVTGQIFQMLDAVATGNRIQTVKLYKELLELRESPMMILRLLARHCNILLQVKTEKEHYSRQELAKKVGIAPFFAGKYIGQAENFQAEQLKEMLSDCVQTEFDFKRGRISDQIGVELLLVDFTQKNGKRTEG